MFFNTLHNLVVFIVLGVAADDVFVMHDAWKQSSNILEYEGNVRKRMSYAWKRATKAMLVTTSTTCLAFLSTALSSIVPIRSFGLYAAIIIPVNYILIIVMLPPMLIFYDKYLAHRLFCINFKRSEKKRRYSQGG